MDKLIEIAGGYASKKFGMMALALVAIVMLVHSATEVNHDLVNTSVLAICVMTSIYVFAQAKWSDATPTSGDPAPKPPSV